MDSLLQDLFLSLLPDTGEPRADDELKPLFIQAANQDRGWKIGDVTYWDVRRELLRLGDIRFVKGRGLKAFVDRPRYQLLKTANFIKSKSRDEIMLLSYLPLFLSILFKAEDAKLSAREKIHLGTEYMKISKNADLAPGLQLKFEFNDLFKKMMDPDQIRQTVADLLRLLSEMPASLKNKFLPFIPHISQRELDAIKSRKNCKDNFSSEIYEYCAQLLDGLGLDLSTVNIKEFKKNFKQERRMNINFRTLAINFAWISGLIIWVFFRKPGVSFFKFGWVGRTLTPAGIFLIVIIFFIACILLIIHYKTRGKNTLQR